MDDYILRIGCDFYLWIVWWFVAPLEHFSHWMSVEYGIEPFKIHSTLFSEELIWHFHVGSLLIIICAVGFPLGVWYKCRFRKTMKRRRRTRIFVVDEDVEGLNMGKGTKSLTQILKNNHSITQAINKGLVKLEIMVQTRNKES